MSLFTAADLNNKLDTFVFCRWTTWRCKTG